MDLTSDKNDVITLCRNGCCPSMVYTKGQYVIEDDFGGKVTLSTENMEELMGAFEKFRTQQQQPLSS